MPKIIEFEPIFVKNYIPNEIEEGKLYISSNYRIAIHKCACGCGEEVVTDFDNQRGWDLKKNDDNTVTLYPSIGNFNFPCKSHYYITNNKVIWC